jgi:hypothetical protein
MLEGLSSPEAQIYGHHIERLPFPRVVWAWFYHHVKWRIAIHGLNNHSGLLVRLYRYLRKRVPLVRLNSYPPAFDFTGEENSCGQIPSH